MDGHVLHCELNLDGQTAKLHHLAHAEPDGNRPDIPRRRGEVGQDITRVPEAPALAEEDRGDGLQIHLARVRPAVLAADGSPLLREHADEVLLRKVARHDTGSELPLALAREARGRSREDRGRPNSQDPVARVRRRQ